MSVTTRNHHIPDTLRALVDENVDGIVVVTPDGIIEHVNRRAQELAELPPEEILGRPFQTFFEDGVRDKAFSCFSSVTPGSEVLEVTRLFVGGKPLLDVELRARRIEDGRIIAVLRDVGDLRRHQRALHLVSHALSEKPGQPFFDAIVEAMAQALPIDYAFVGELVHQTPERVRLLAFRGPDGPESPGTYHLQGTPCEVAIRERRSVFTRDAPSEYPEDQMLQAFGAHTYQAIPLLGENVEPIGILGILNRSPTEEDPLVTATLDLVASRAAAEIRRVKIDEERRRAERNLRALMQASSRFVWGVDADGKPTLSDMTAWQEATGRTNADEEAHRWLEALVPEDRAKTEEAWRRALAEERDLDIEYRVRGPSGERHLHVRGIAIHTGDGTFEGFLGTIDDVTEHYRAADELRRRNEILRALRVVPEATHDGAGFLESIRVGMAEMCRIGGFTLGRLYMQDSEGGDFGYSGLWSADGIADGLETLADGLNSPFRTDAAVAARVLDTRDPLWLEDLVLARPEADDEVPTTWADGGTALYVPVRHGDEPVAILELLADHRREPDDTVVEVLSQIAMQLGRSYEREVSRRQTREAERKARESQKLEAVGRLAGGIAHDFNNILMVMLGEAELALRTEGVPANVQDSLAEIRKSAKRAGALTSQLLAFSRREMETPERVDVGTLVHDAERMLRRIIGENIELDTDGVRPDAGWHVEVAPGLMEQILVNLVVNAREAMPDGGTVTIDVRREELRPTEPGAEPGQYVVMTVTDTGTGIPDDIRDAIFEPFFTTKEDGTGFGLSTTYGIVRGAGGFIDFDSQEGSGSEFRIHLPVVPDGTRRTVPEAGAAKRTGSGRVLVVEDDDGVRSVAIRILGAAGYEVEAARGRDDVEAYLAGAEQPPDVLVTDCVLKETTGRAVDTRVRERFPDVATVFMSGYTDDVLLKQGVRPEGSAFLAKPFSPEALVESVERVMAERPHELTHHDDDTRSSVPPRGTP